MAEAASPSPSQAAPAAPSSVDGAVDSTQQPSQPTTTGTSADALSMQQHEEASLDAEISNTSGTADADADPSIDDVQPPQPHTNSAAAAPSNISHPAVIEPRIPTKKDASLRAFLRKTDDYAPLIPDAVTDYYLTLAGLPPPPETDRRLARLLALATQKFVADIAADAYQYSRIRSTNTTSNNPLTGLGGAAGFGAGGGGGGGEDGGAAGAKGKQGGTKGATLGGPRAGYGGGGSGTAGQGRTVLTMEDLGMAVGEYGVNVKRGEFYR